MTQAASPAYAAPAGEARGFVDGSKRTWKATSNLRQTAFCPRCLPRTHSLTNQRRCQHPTSTPPAPGPSSQAGAVSWVTRKINKHSGEQSSAQTAGSSHQGKPLSRAEFSHGPSTGTHSDTTHTESRSAGVHGGRPRRTPNSWCQATSPRASPPPVPLSSPSSQAVPTKVPEAEQVPERILNCSEKPKM